MQLIGMLDSPYVRRVAVSLQLLDLPFEHRALSVFRTYPQFRDINPLVKAPTLVCDDGTTLIDSSLILDYAEHLNPTKSLLPSALGERQRALRILGLALAACEKSVQIIYERELRPAETRHQPWLDRVSEQLLAAYQALETELLQAPLAVEQARIDQAGITTAVAWYFTQAMVPDVVRGDDFPALQRFSQAAEALPAFCAAPHGLETYRAG
ncbi:MAG: glutathione S-transferase [Pseudomonadota bacterium]